MFHPRRATPDTPLRALVFDSHYDSYRGVISYVRVVDGVLNPRDKLRLMSTDGRIDPIEIGIVTPGMTETKKLTAGSVGYIATGLKTVRDCRVGETMTTAVNGTNTPLAGYEPAKPMVFAGFYPVDNDDYGDLRDALEKLQLNDASLTFVPESSTSLEFRLPCRLFGAVPHDDYSGTP